MFENPEDQGLRRREEEGEDPCDNYKQSGKYENYTEVRTKQLINRF